MKNTHIQQDKSSKATTITFLSAKSLIVLCFGVYGTLGLHAAPRLHPLFADRAVLQRDVPLPIFGTARPGEKVNVTLGARNQFTITDADGKWSVEFPPTSASGIGMVLEASGEDGPPARATDIVIGDVWLLGGQSNMHHAFRTYPLLKDAPLSINDPEIRLLHIPPQTKSGGAKNANQNSPNKQPFLINPIYRDAWQPACPPFLDHFSPAGYYFGAALRRELNVPIGLVLSAEGGTQIERWLPLADALKVKHSAFFRDKPSDLYEKMIAPLRGFAWRGVAWYQGESNANDPLSYGPLLESLIAGWRRELALEGRPFLIVQIAPFDGASAQIKPESWAWLREQQSRVAENAKNAGLVVTLDLGEAEDIHPQNKHPIGERLALWAIKLAGRKVQAAGPRFQRQEIKGPELWLSFSETAGGLKTQRVAMNRKKNLPFGTDPGAAVTPSDQLLGFKICGIDRIFHPAEARIHGDRVVLTSSSVPQPVAARYAWDNFPLGNLFGGSGLPAEPFRTDDFPPPDFGLPLIGTPAPVEPPGDSLVLLKDGKENPYGPEKIVDGRQAHVVLKTTKPEIKFQGRYVYAKIPEGVVHPGGRVIISIIYYDNFPNTVKLRYDSADQSVQVSRRSRGVFKELGHFRMEGSGQWRMVEFEVTDGRFNGRCNGADIRLDSFPDKDLVIGGIYMRPLSVK